MKCSCEQISLAPFLTGKLLGISNWVSEQRNHWKNRDDWRRGAQPRLWEGDRRCWQGTGAGQTSRNGQSLFFFAAISFFCSLSSLPAWMVFSPVPSLVTLVFACWLLACLAVLGGGTCEHAVPALGGQGWNLCPKGEKQTKKNPIFFFLGFFFFHSVRGFWHSANLVEKQGCWAVVAAFCIGPGAGNNGHCRKSDGAAVTSRTGPQCLMCPLHHSTTINPILLKDQWT